jgi:hypothetical protein
MKFVNFPQKSFCGAVMSFLFLLLMGTPALAQLSTGQNDPPPLKINWNNNMTDPGEASPGAMCVMLDNLNTVYVFMRLYAATPEIQSLPPMYFKYSIHIDGLQPIDAVTSAITPADFTIWNGSSYRATRTLPVDCSAICPNPISMSNQGDFCFKISFTLVKEEYPGSGTYIPYPVGQYPTIWPPEDFPPIGPGYLSPTLLERKRVCCFGGNNGMGVTCPSPLPPGGLSLTNSNNVNSVGFSQQIDLTGTQMNALSTNMTLSGNEIANSGQIAIFPNPSSSTFTVRFQQLTPGKTVIECLDMQGRSIRVLERVYESDGLYESRLDLQGLASGIYFLHVSTPNYSKMEKIIKTGE